MNKKHKSDLWAECWIAVAASDNCSRLRAPTEYADEMIKQYDDRFKIEE